MRGREGKGWAGKTADPSLSGVFDPHIERKSTSCREEELPIGESQKRQVLDSVGKERGCLKHCLGLPPKKVGMPSASQQTATDRHIPQPLEGAETATNGTNPSQVAANSLISIGNQRLT